MPLQYPIYGESTVYCVEPQTAIGIIDGIFRDKSKVEGDDNLYNHPPLQIGHLWVPHINGKRVSARIVMFCINSKTGSDNRILFVDSGVTYRTQDGFPSLDPIKRRLIAEVEREWKLTITKNGVKEIDT